jgi:hypothetical protein
METFRCRSVCYPCNKRVHIKEWIVHHLIIRPINRGRRRHTTSSNRRIFKTAVPHDLSSTAAALPPHDHSITLTNWHRCDLPFWEHLLKPASPLPHHLHGVYGHYHQHDMIVCSGSAITAGTGIACCFSTGLSPAVPIGCHTSLQRVFGSHPHTGTIAAGTGTACCFSTGLFHPHSRCAALASN